MVARGITCTGTELLTRPLALVPPALTIKLRTGPSVSLEMKANAQI